MGPAFAMAEGDSCFSRDGRGVNSSRRRGAEPGPSRAGTADQAVADVVELLVVAVLDG